MTFFRALRTLAVLLPSALLAQSTATLNLYPGNAANEQTELNQAVTEANGSKVDLMRALEQHLLKYPNSPRRAEIEASLYKAAVETNDSARIARWGAKLLEGKPDNELEILDRVIRALLADNDVEGAKKAAPYCARYIAAVENFRAGAPEGHTTKAQWADLGDRAFSRAMTLNARATGILGNAEQALTSATQSWLLQPSGESAQEIARWSLQLGRDADAIEHYADAAAIDDAREPWSDRERAHKKAAELYVKLHGSDQGLGDVFERAWERDAKALRDRAARYKAIDPNYGLTSFYDFALPGGGNLPPDTPALDMSKLRGKTLVVDFWATWCMPCIAQHPLIEKVKQKYAQSPDVVFLSLDADDDHSLVAPFLKAKKWDQRVWLEAGLAGLLQVTSLPTVLVVGPDGSIYSRMMGFSADVFERMLSARIDGARSLPARK